MEHAADGFWFLAGSKSELRKTSEEKNVLISSSWSVDWTL